MERYRITEESSVYFVTYSIVEWLPVLVTDLTCNVIVESLSYCSREKHLGVNAWVLMPTHMHAIVFDTGFDSQRLARTLTDFRKFTGRRLADICQQRFPKCFSETLRESATADR